MTDESKEIRVMRGIAWARAKGELDSVLQTYWTNRNFEKMAQAIDDFIALVEENGWQE